MAAPDRFRPIEGMDDPFRYRDKVISPFVYGKKLPGGKRDILTGMYEAGTHKVLPTPTCIVENEVAQRVVRAIRQIMMRHGIEPYDEDRGVGFIRHAVVRVGHESGEVLVTLVTNGREFPHSKSFCQQLIKRVPEVVSVVQNVNTRRTNVILGAEDRTLYGPGFILDTLCDLTFRISPQSFYQVNSQQTEVLYRSAMESARPEEGGTFIDAYCGTGTVGLVAASMGADEVIGVDTVDAAIRDARMNAKHNGIDNATFVCADATDFLQDITSSISTEVSEANEVERSLTILMDPPRAGSTEEFLEAAVRLQPKRIVYISCNPKTQARDARYLLDHGFQIEAIQPIDMFPQTKHIENIISFIIDK